MGFYVCSLGTSFVAVDAMVGCFLRVFRVIPFPVGQQPKHRTVLEQIFFAAFCIEAVFQNKKARKRRFFLFSNERRQCYLERPGGKRTFPAILL